MRDEFDETKFKRALKEREKFINESRSTLAFGRARRLTFRQEINIREVSDIISSIFSNYVESAGYDTVHLNINKDRKINIFVRASAYEEKFMPPDEGSREYTIEAFCVPTLSLLNIIGIGVDNKKRADECLDLIEDKLSEYQKEFKGAEAEDMKQNLDEVECPFCAEIIKAKAIKCKHCDERVEPQTKIGKIISE